MPEAEEKAATRSQGPPGPFELTSESLFSGRREIAIRHGSEVYRLRMTRMNKLILTK